MITSGKKYVVCGSPYLEWLYSVKLTGVQAGGSANWQPPADFRVLQNSRMSHLVARLFVGLQSHWTALGERILLLSSVNNTDVNRHWHTASCLRKTVRHLGCTSPLCLIRWWKRPCVSINTQQNFISVKKKTKCVGHSPSEEVKSLPSQYISRILMYPKVHYLAHNSPPIFFASSQINPYRTNVENRVSS